MSPPNPRNVPTKPSQVQRNWQLLKLTTPRQADRLASMQELTCNGSPATEEDLLGHRVVRWGAELGHYDGQHQVLRNLLALLAVTQLQVRHVREG